MEYETFEELMELLDLGILSILKSFRIVKMHKPYFISNCKFYEIDAEYMFEHIELKEPVKAEHHDFYYDFNCHQSKAERQFADREFDDFKHSIRLI